MLIALGVGQLVLIVVAFSLVIDPGPPAFDAIGTLTGLGMAAGCAAVAATAEPRHRTTFRVLSVAAVVGGIAYAGTWLSLFGGAFRLNDLPRIGVLVASDTVVAGWFLVAAWTLRRPRPQGFLGVGVVLAMRAIIELRDFAGMLAPAPPRPAGTSSGIEGIFVAALVLTGFVLLAFWQIGLARWLFGWWPRRPGG